MFGILIYKVSFLHFVLVYWVVDAHTIIKIGTRPSPLAIFQAEAVANALVHSDKSIRPTIVPISAAGDVNDSTGKIQDVPLALRAVDFTGALDDALQNEIIDVAVHSCKDIPPQDRWYDDFSITCPLPREDPCDVLLGPYKSLSSLPKGCKVGTSSIRRQAQILSLCGSDNIEVVNVRGNLDARINALEEGSVQALILAQAGLNRLKKKSPSRIINYSIIPTNEMLPGVCQGIVAAVCKTSRISLRQQLMNANNDNAYIAAHTERAFLNILDKSSPWVGRPPLAGLMEYCHLETDDEDDVDDDDDDDDNANSNNSKWRFRGLLACPDGTNTIRTSRYLSSENCSIEDAIKLGTKVGKDLLAKAGPNYFSSFTHLQSKE